MAGIQDILGGIMGSGGQIPADLQKLAEPILQMIQQNGGLQQIIGQLQNSPIGEQVNSWLGTGANQAVSRPTRSQRPCPMRSRIWPARPV